MSDQAEAAASKHEAPAPQGDIATQGDTAPQGDAASQSTTPAQVGKHAPRVYPPPAPPGVSSQANIKEGDMVLLIGKDGKKLMIRAKAGGSRGTHFGQIDIGALIGTPFGKVGYSSKNQPFHTLKPNLSDLVMGLKRATQIIYPKDIAPILMRLNIGPGAKVIECGSGSGALTTCLAWAVGDTGQIYAYDRVGTHLNRNRTNLQNLDMLHRVTHRMVDALEDGFVDGPVDAIFLDMKDAHLAVPHAADALLPGSTLGLLVPTTNQVSYIIDKLESGPWTDIDVQETFFRRYKINKARFRPFDRMIAHTGYLIFARRVQPFPRPVTDPPEETQGPKTEPVPAAPPPDSSVTE